MSRSWRWLLLPAYPLLLLNVLIALLYAKLWCKATSWQWRDGTLTFIAQRTMAGHPGGQGWSWVVGYSAEDRRDRKDLRVHENCHVVQELLFAAAGVPVGVAIILLGHPVLGALSIATLGGALFMVVYGLTFLAGFATRGFSDWHSAYMMIPFEKQAYAKQEAYKLLPPSKQVDIWGHR